MRSKLYYFTLAAASILLIISLVAVLSLRKPTATPVVVVTERTTELSLAVVGRARPRDLVTVVSPNPGQIVRLLHDDGDVVNDGAPLAVVRSAVQQAESEAERARARASRAELAQAVLNLERTRALHARGFAAKAALDAAQAQLNTAEADLAAANATARAASARVQEFTIRAPMRGVVLLRPIDNGQVVAAGEILFELGSTSGVEIEAEVEEAYADALRPGLKARAALSGSTAVFGAQVSEVSPRVDAATGSRLVKLVPEQGEVLSPGRSVDLTIVVGERKNALTVPRSSILDATAAPKVYIADSNNRAQIRPVIVARWPSVNALITSGLKAGDRVIISPESIEEGRRIRPVVIALGG